MRKPVLALIMVMTLAMTSVTGCVKVVKIGEEGKLTGETAFNAGDNVGEIWESQAIPNLEEKAVDLNTFLDEASGDFVSLAEKYGKYSMGTSGELSYTVKGSGTVTEVNREKKAGYIVVSLEGHDDVVVKLQIGSVYKGSAVRDSLDFIKFEDYKNQVDYAAVSQSIHDIIDETVISTIDFDSLSGKTVDFTGCFTVNGSEELLITPIILSVL